MNEKLQIDIYKGLPMVLEKIKGVALSAVIGKTPAWLQQKLERTVVKGLQKEFVSSDLDLINNGLELLGQEISQSMVNYTPVREEVIEQIKNLNSFIAMPYIYDNVLGKGRRWYVNRMVQRKPGCSVCSFKEDDILAINMAAMQIANELKSIEFVLK